MEFPQSSQETLVDAHHNCDVNSGWIIDFCARVGYSSIHLYTLLNREKIE